MKQHTQKELKERDLKERKLGIMEETARVGEDMYLRSKKEFKKALDRYQVWKEKHEIPGVKY